jgi:hypothetical protein
MNPQTEVLEIDGHTVTIEQDRIGWWKVTFADFPWIMESHQTLEAARKAAHERYQPKPRQRRSR